VEFADKSWSAGPEVPTVKVKAKVKGYLHILLPSRAGLKRPDVKQDF